MKTFLLSFLGGVAALFLFFIVLPFVILMSVLPSSEPAATRNAVLELDLRQVQPDQPAPDGVSALFSDMSFVEMLLRLNAAATDPNVKGVFVRASEFDMGSSRGEELRAAFLRLRENGKFVIAHSQGFIASGPGAYRAIAAADEIWIQPGSSFEVPGLTFETLFLGEALNRLKVTPEIVQLFEYKNAPDTFKQSDYTPAHAESVRALGESVWAGAVADIAADRKLEPAAARALLEASPYTAEQAVELKLADKLGWPEEAADAAEERADGELVWIGDYAPPSGSGPEAIAIVGGEGDIVTGEGSTGGVLSLGAAQFASDRVARDLLELAEDDDIKAVVFRVDSGGGSAIASDQVWRAVERLQQAGKKVVVSMGSLAASGGYYVGAGADAIVANRSTITGSIGAFGGKFALAEGLREFGVNPSQIQVGGPFASAYSTETLTDEQRRKLSASLQNVYDRFTGLVAQGRNLPTQRVQEIARGRIWSGADAKAIGLVDETGDLVLAIDKAKELAGIAPDEKVRIRLRIAQPNPFDLLRGLAVSAQASAADPAFMQMMGAIAGDRRAAAALRDLRLGARPGTQLAAPSMMER
jgi:protease IV